MALWVLGDASPSAPSALRAPPSAPLKARRPPRGAGTAVEAQGDVSLPATCALGAPLTEGLKPPECLGTSCPSTAPTWAMAV